MTLIHHRKKEVRPWVRSGAILGIIDFLERYGLEPEEVFGKSPLKMAEAADPYRQVDLLYLMSIFQKVTDHTERPEMGLKLGLSIQLQQLGAFGFLFLNAPTLGVALTDFVRFGPVFQTQAYFNLKKGKRRFCIEYSSNHPEMPGWDIDSEVTIGYIMCIVNGLTGQKNIPDEIHADHPQLCDISDYKKLTEQRPLFNQSTNRLYYPLSLLNIPIHGANPLLYTVLLHHMNDMANTMPKENNLKDVVKNNIRRGLSSNTVTLEHIASEVGFEPRTLQRRLSETGTSFQALIDDVRLDLACYYLEKTPLDVTEIALVLGYAESSVFSRAFKRWTGHSPDAHRKAMKHEE